MSTNKVETRHHAILAFLQEYQEVNINQISQVFKISQVTARRDLQTLRNQQLVWKAGKESYTSHPLLSTDAFDKELKEVRIAIAAAAVNSLRDGEIIFIGTGEINNYVCNLLANNKKGLTIITSNVNHASILRRQTLNDVYLLGGRINPETGEVGGVLAIEMLRDYRIDTVLLGCKAINPEIGLVMESTAESRIIHTAIEQTRRVIVIADHTCFNSNSSGSVFPLEEVHSVYTDKATYSSEINRLKKMGINIVLV